MQHKYSYKPLSNPNSIRILTILPSSDPNSPIKCTITQARIGDGTPYTALSYSWATDDGDTSSNNLVTIVDDDYDDDSSPSSSSSPSASAPPSPTPKVLSITPNLSSALHRLRPRSPSPIPMWIDALSIDQTNPDERSAQVAKMAEIFANASEMLIWLGEGVVDEAENERVAEILECFSRPGHGSLDEHVFRTEEGDEVRVCPIFAKIWGKVAAEPGKYLDREGEGKGGMDPWRGLRGGKGGTREWALFDPFDSATNVGLHCREWELEFAAGHINRIIISFARTRYFTRRWVIQELFHADHDNACILWGKHSLPLRDFELAVGRLHPSLSWREVLDLFDDELDHSRHGSAFYAVQKIGKMLGLPDVARTKKENFLLWVMSTSNGSFCSDPRDFLYSILNIDPFANIKLDYRSTPADVYISFAAYLIERGLYAEYLLYAADRSTHRQSKDSTHIALPTWCIDLRQHFDLPKNVPPVGPCSLEDSRVLSTSARMLGSIKNDEKIESRHPPSRFYIYSEDAGPGDLLCMFADYKMRYPDRLIPAIIIRVTSEDSSLHRIAGWSYVCYDTWEPSLYDIRQIRLC